jgi:hypothetical protein
VSPAAPSRGRRGGRLVSILRVVAVLACAGLTAPAQAAADGPVSPTATNFYARATRVPSGIQAKVVDEYLNLWVKVPASAHVTVLDYRGAPWVRFSPAGVSVNTNSDEYYLSQVPVPAVPPRGLAAATAPHWKKISGGHSYQWREGRLHALATIALRPGQTFIGHWHVAVVINGRHAVISGGIWHRGAPSIIWFWPVLVLIVCVLAAWRVQSRVLDRRLSTSLALALLVLAGVGIAGKYLHGSPSVTAGNLILLVLTVLVLLYVAVRLLRHRSSGALLLVTTVLALWVGLTLLPVLTHGYALISLPLFLTRAITAALLGGAIALVPFCVRLLDRDAT